MSLIPGVHFFIHILGTKAAIVDQNKYRVHGQKYALVHGPRPHFSDTLTVLRKVGLPR